MSFYLCFLLYYQMDHYSIHPLLICKSTPTQRNSILPFSPLASLVTQLVKNLPAVWEIWVQSLGWEDPLEKGLATHSNILAWRFPWTL